MLRMVLAYITATKVTNDDIFVLSDTEAGSVFRISVAVSYLLFSV